MLGGRLGPDRWRSRDPRIQVAPASRAARGPRSRLRGPGARDRGGRPRATRASWWSATRRARPRPSPPATPDTLVIAGDTEVVIDGEVLGQPESRGRGPRAPASDSPASEHHVLGGLALIGPDGDGEPPHRGRRLDASPSGSSTTRSSTAYLASGEWRGRAGSLRDPGSGLGAGGHRPAVTSPTSSACRSGSCFGSHRSCRRSGTAGNLRTLGNLRRAARLRRS